VLTKNPILVILGFLFLKTEIFNYPKINRNIL